MTMKKKRKASGKQKNQLGKYGLYLGIAAIGLGIWYLGDSGYDPIPTSPEAIARGETKYNQYCAACHGQNGVGEDPRKADPMVPRNMLAPALNDDAHAWHHTDDNLMGVILNGSAQPGSRMIAWKTALSEEDAGMVVAYIKSLWSPRSLACQGPKHMTC